MSTELNISAYLCNTYENLASNSWQMLSERNITKYCNRHNIPISVIGFDDERVQKLISATIKSGRKTNKTNPLIRKIFRLYDFLDSGDDYGLFIDLDTIIINKDVDVRSCIRLGENYIQCSNSSRDKIWDGQKASGNPRKYNYSLTKYDFAERMHPNAKHKHMVSNTGFSILNRDFCLKYADYLENNFLNFNKEEHILSYYNNYPDLPYTVKGMAHCSDEFFFDAYLRSDEKIIDQIKNPSVKYDWQQHRLCTHSGIDEIIGKRSGDFKLWDSRLDFEDHTLQYFFDHDPIFHHTLKEKNAELCLPLAMRIFSV